MWTLCHTTQHRTILIICPLNLQTITITRMLSSREEGVINSKRYMYFSCISCMCLLCRKNRQLSVLDRRRPQISAGPAARRIFSGGGGAARFRLAAAAEFGGWGVYRTPPLIWSRFAYILNHRVLMSKLVASLLLDACSDLFWCFTSVSFFFWKN